MNSYAAHLESLAESMHPSGGWGYAPGQTPQLEPSCFALLALSLDPTRFADHIAMTRAFIEQHANDDGSYRPLDGREEAIWPTALVLFTQAACGVAGSATPQAVTISYLLGIRGRVPDQPEAGELHDIDLNLVGWPWAEKNFSWVEPTAWAVLALRFVGQAEHPRVQEGIHMLLDRAMDTGGINYGNRLILGKMTDPIPGPTAMLLLALQNSRLAPRDESVSRSQTPTMGTVSQSELGTERVAAAVSYLLEQLNTDDIEHLCWTKIALDLYRRLPSIDARLLEIDAHILAAAEKRRRTGWLKPNCYRQALMVLALGVENRNVFRLPEQVAKSDLGALTIGDRQPSFFDWIGGWYRRFILGAVSLLRSPPKNSAVHVARAESYDADLAGIMQKQYEHFRVTVPLKGKRVVLKPNLVEWHRDKVINTDPRVVGAVIELCKREGAAEIIVAEGPGHWRNVEYLVAESGLGEVLEKHGVRFVDINHDEPVKCPNIGQLTGLEFLYLSRTIVSADVLISLPKLKTHHWAGATLALKNLFGTLPGIYYGWPKNELHWRGIHNSIVDIALTRTPHLAIVDGIIGMEGDGPLNGEAKPFGALVMGQDLVAVDATCCRLMMLDPAKIGYLVLGNDKSLGRMHEAEIPQLGESIASLAQPFATVPHLNDLRVRSSA